MTVGRMTTFACYSLLLTARPVRNKKVCLPLRFCQLMSVLIHNQWRFDAYRAAKVTNHDFDIE